MVRPKSERPAVATAPAGRDNSSRPFDRTGGAMRNTALKDAVTRLLPRVQAPAQYLGGELHSVAKDHRHVRGRLCLAFPDTYSLGMSHHGLQVLYSTMNADPRW